MEPTTSPGGATKAPTDTKPSAHRPRWREVTLSLPERTADFMERIKSYEWTGALLVLGCGGHPLIRQLANMANLMRDIVEKGPRSCAKGRADWGESAKLIQQLYKDIQVLNNKLNHAAEALRVRLPKTPKRRYAKEA